MKRFIVGFIPLSFMVGLPAIAGRMACVLTAALLLCASSAHGQVIEEGGFPVKGGGVSGESFSLTCPPRVFAEAGESVLFSCSATAVPEEGVRYEWESLSGDGLHLLSDVNEHSPLFMAPLSGESAEYVYRLAAMSVGVYETATVTVSVEVVLVEVVSGETVSAPVVQEECDSFGGFGRDREGCHPWEKAPWPDSFGGLPEDEGIVPWPSFPESPGAEDKEFPGSSGEGSFPQTPPYLDCPSAVFLEELETGQIECHVSDASGEEYLDYSWEPVGNTTRDYLDNPLLIPEDSPTPSVVAPEAPVYETLESFHSGETTFRYRYRLTATSRATGLSSSSEVEVFVSSSRPSVYCPLEVVVEEGSTAQLDCEGADPLSHRMDYDEEEASVLWEWEGLWGTSTAHLDATDMSSPLFMAPVGSAGEEYHYIASMTSSASGMPRTARRRVKVTVREAGEEGTQAAADDSALMFKGSAPVVTCNDAEVYEDTADFTLDCSVTDEPTGATYAWTARGSTSDTDDLSSTTVLTPTFDVPDEVGGADKTYRYTVTMSAAGIDDQAKNVTVIVLEKPNIGCTLINPDVNVLDRAMEPGEQWTFDPCLGSFVGAPSGSEYKFTWTGVWTACCTPEIALAHLDRTDVEETVFTAPTASPYPNIYIFFTYELIVSAKNADPYTISPLGVTVQTQQKPQLSLTCSETSYEVETGDPDFDLDCEAAGAWSSGFGYKWQWSPTDNLTGHDTGTPTFDVPGSVESDTTWTYTVSVSAKDHLPADETVEVTVREPKPSIACSDAEVYEATADFTLDCSVTNEPSGASYSWTARGSTSDTDDLSSTTILAPTFSVPDSVNADTDYDYTVTLSASGVDDVTEDVTVTVKKINELTCLRYGQVLDGYFYGINEGDMRGVVLDVCHEITGPGPFSYSWSNRLSILGGLDRLSNTNERSPTFTPPNDVETLISYGYSLEISSPNAKSLKVFAGIWIYDTNLTCQDSVVYEGSANFDLDCSIVVGPEATYPPPKYRYTWVARDDTPNTDLLIAGRGSLAPTFAVPDNVDADTDYKYRLTVIGNGGTLHEGDVTVTVKNTPSLTLVCTPPAPVYEGSADFALDCSASGAPSGSTYDYVWTARGATPNTDKLSSTTVAKPTFDVPEEVADDETYEYLLTVSAENAIDATANVTVRVLNKEPLALICTPVAPVYEGAEDFDLDCSASGAPSGSDYDYVWTPRGATSNTDELSSTTIAKPTFNVPEEVDRDETYRYTLTASADNAEDASANVTVRVLNKAPLALICAPVAPVYEGAADFTLDCSASGAPAGSGYDYVWTGRGSTVVPGQLSSTTIAKPTFDVPGEVAGDETYEYTLTASAENAEDASANVTVRVLNKAPLALICTPPTPVYEGSADFTLDCSASGAPSGSTYDYVWTARGATPNTDKLSSTTVAKPTFDVPEEVAEDETYRYTLTASAENAEDASANVTVTVLNKPSLTLVCTPPAPVYEGAADFDLDCVASGAPSGSTYDYVWTARGATPNTDKLSSTTVAKPTFDVPEEVDRDETYRYTLTAGAENAEDASANVTVRVLNKEPLALICTPPTPVYEGSADFALDCSASGAPSGSTYDYVWTARGATPNTDKLSSTTVAKPTFDVPEEVDRDETYRYTLTAGAENAEDASANVTVRVLNKEPLALICTPPTPVYEGSADFALDCSASGAPSGSTYDYVWTARGATPNTDKLSSTTVEKPTFDVPEEVAEDETYRYTLTASAENAEDASANVTVRVLNKAPLALICTPPTPVYESAADFALDCSASGAPSGSTYDYVWTARGATPNTDKLSSTTIEKPTFDVPEEVAEDETYRYTLTASAENAEDASANVTVQVLNKEPLALVCTPVAPVYEGSEDFALNCSASGAPSASTYDYVWTARGATPNTGKLSSTTIAKPTFDVPEEVDRDETYEYTLTVSAENAENASANVTVRVLNKEPLALICTPPTPVYEGSADFTLDCSASGAPSGSTYDYVWTARGATPNTDKLSSTTIAKPTFDVPEEVDRDETYEYTLTVSADHAESATEDVTVTVLNKKALDVACATPSPVYEGSEDFALDCAATGAPAGSDYTYVWTGRGSTVNTDLLVSGTDGPTPTFDVPEEVDEDETYEYLLTVSAENAEDATAEVTVKVLNLGSIALICASPPLVYEGSADFALDCSILGDTGNADYTYEWTARGATANTDLLSATDSPTPTFAVPDQLEATTTYEYLLTASAENAEDATAEVTVTVLNRGTLDVACAPPPLVYEGSVDFDLDCSASGAPVGSEYAYVWTARGATSNTDLLIAGTDGPTPTFAVPDALEATTTYEYLLTASAENAESGSAAVTVTVLNRGTLDVACVPPPLVYEGAADFALDCSASGAPVGSDYEYVWTGRGSTANTDLLIAGTDGPTPTFAVPDQLDETTTYEYLLTARAENVEDATSEVTVTVLNRGTLDVACVPPPLVYEGAADFALDCSASGAPVGSDYEYVWTGRGSTVNTDLLTSGTDSPTPTFAVPDALDETTTYEYLLTASAENAESGSAAVTVTVLNRGALSVVCVDPPSVYEGSADFDLDCSASGAPVGSDYEYVWAGRGSTVNTDLLTSGTDSPTPTFAVPDALDETTTYEYLLTASAENAESGSAAVTVTVLNRGALSVVCADPPSIYEGSADFDLDCSASGAPAGSEYTYAWTARGSTANTDLLIAGTDGPTPTFAVPEELDATTTYEYLLTASAENAESGSAAVTVTVLNVGALRVVCADPPSVYEGSEDFDLDCSASGAPAGSGYAYVWTARGSTSDTALLISGTDGPTPTFAVPEELAATTTYEYLLTASAENAEDATAEVTVTVLNAGALRVVCASPASVYEGSEDFDLDCSASGAPAGSDYAYVWTARGSTANTDILIAGTNGPTPTFSTPDEVEETTTYEYLLTASAENAESGSAEVTVTVLNRGPLSVVCADPPSVYEGSEDFDLDCSASGAPAGSEYDYVWTAQGDTANTLQLSATDISSPTFYVPDEVDETTTYEYLLTASAENMEDATAEVMVTVLNRGALSVVCADPPSIYEGSEDFALDCSASGAPAGSDYAYVWTARGSTANTDILIAGTNGPTPTFSTPDEVEETTTYEYLLTASAENAESGSAEVTVTVLNRGALSVVCADPPSVYEGSEDFDLDCSASGAPAGSEYDYVWTAQGDTANTLQLSATDISSPTFYVPDEVDETTTYEYLLTASAENMEDATAEVMVTVLNRGALSVVCADPPSIYEGSEDFALDCSASGAPAGSAYEYSWTARGSTENTLQLSATDISSPTFYVPDEVDETTTYEYLLTASAENMEDATAEVMVTVLNRGALSVVCADPPSIYEGSEDFALDCSASGAPAGSDYAYVWTARGSTENTLQLSATDISSPTFYVPNEVDETTTYEYLLTVSADNVEDGTVAVTVTVLNRGALSVVCADPPSVYEGSEDFDLDCSASGAPAGSEYDYVWTAQGDTANTLQLSATDISSPTFYVPDEVDETTDYEYLLTASAENMEDATAEVMVTVLNRGALSVVCADPPSIYEGSEDFALDCSASGAPAGSAYEYSWTARGSTENTLQLSATDISSPTFYVPDEVDETTDYEYLLTASAENMEDATAEVTVTVLNGAPLAFVDDSIASRVYVFTVGESIEDILLPQATGGLSPYTYTLTPALPEGLELDDTTRTISGTPLEVSPRTEYTWQVTDANVETAQIAFFIEVVPAEEPTSVPVAETSSELPEPSSLGVTVSVSSLRFGVQSAGTQVSLDPMTDGISTHVSGPYHAGRMTLSPGGSEALDENGEMDLSIELASPVVLRRERGIKATSIVLSPQWSLAESCEQLSSQAIGGLYTEVTLSEADCRLLRFGGELDLTDVPSGRYMGSLDIILRSGESEETHSVDVEVRVVPAQRVITIGPGGVRFSTSRELPAGLTEEQNLSIYPDVAFLTEEKPNGVFELSNPSLIPLEVSVSTSFGYTEATENGREVVVEDVSESHLGDLSQVVDIHPGVLVLMPGEKGLVRYGMQEGALATMAEKGYAAFFDVVSEPRQYVRLDQMPEEVSGEKTARVTMRVPGVYVPGEGASQLRAALLSISYVGSLSATFLLETQDHPFVGEVLAYDGEGRELGRRETLVYTRSRVRIPLDRVPEGGAVFLRFAPRGSDRVPLPASVEWDAPRRDIGAADKDHTRPPQTLVQKP